jgi:DNA-binding response OmpR family regulator
LRVVDSDESLIDRVVVVPGARAALLAESLTAAGIGARVWAGDVNELADLPAGLILFDVRDDSGWVAAGLQALRTRQARVAVAVIGALDENAAAELLRTQADVILPPDTPIAVIAAQLQALARLIALAPRLEEPDTITVRNMTIDLARREVRAGGRVIPLTPTEFRILAQLARRPGRVVTHAEIFREVHGYDATEQEAKNILKVHVWRLRSKLAEAAPGRSAIVNVRGFGYMLERRAGRDRRRRAAEST